MAEQPLGRIVDRGVVVLHRDGAPSLPSRVSGLRALRVVEFIEAAVHCGRTDIAADAVRKLAEVTSASGTDWAYGVEARCRALVSQGEAAEDHFRESTERLGRTLLRPDLARAHLLYGEWLRRERRRTEARAELRVAHDMFEEIGMEGFVQRAQRELQATGEVARKRTVAPDPQMLTPQEYDRITGVYDFYEFEKKHPQIETAAV